MDFQILWFELKKELSRKKETGSFRKSLLLMTKLEIAELQSAPKCEGRDAEWLDD